MAPRRVLTAAGSGREIDLDHPGVTLALIAFTQETQAAAAALGEALRQHYPEATRVLVAHLVDLTKVPRLMHGIARGIIEGEYRKAEQELPAGLAAWDYVLILPDWDGDACRSLGFSGLDRRPGVAVITATGRLTGMDQGDDPAGAALSLVERALMEEADPGAG